MDEYSKVIIIKNFFINLLIYFIFFKIINYNKKSIKKLFAIPIVAVLTTVIYIIVRKNVNQIIAISTAYLIQVIYLKIALKNEKKLVVAANLIANAIAYIGFGVAAIIEFPLQRIFRVTDNIINSLLILVTEMIGVYLIFKVKRFNNGFSFFQDNLKGDYLEVILINIVLIILFIYCLFENSDSNLAKNIFIPFIILGVIMFIMIQKTLILYYKQKLLEKTLEENKQEIANKDKQIQELQNEKFKISKVSHEFYNRQKALELAVKEYISNTKAEASNEIAITNKINELSKEYSGKIEKIKTPEKLPLTGINEIDRMFKYMQSECENNKIDFNLQINCNVFYMVNNIISKNRLETLIGDHIRDAIIAVNHSPSKNKGIIAIIGIKEGSYEFSVYDTGIEFEIDTLIKLGLEPTTTHKESGGTGIGFITTFETMEETKASLIIEEKHKITENDYTKSISIRFDGKHQYTIKSYRAEEIEKKNKTNRITIKKL